LSGYHIATLGFRTGTEVGPGMLTIARDSPRGCSCRVENANAHFPPPGTFLTIAAFQSLTNEKSGKNCCLMGSRPHPKTAPNSAANPDHFGAMRDGWKIQEFRRPYRADSIKFMYSRE